MLLFLSVVGATVAAPQGLSRSVVSSGSDENQVSNHNVTIRYNFPFFSPTIPQVVTNVISALGPSISAAVQEALAALNAESSASWAAQAQAAVSAQAASRRAAASRAEEQRRQQQISAKKNNFNTQVPVDQGPYESPVYNFEYKVADEEAETFISRNEERNGDSLSGSYTYVDATGSLVKVDYTAGVEGYAETRTLEPNFVQMRANPAWTGPLAGLEEAGAGITIAKKSSSGSSFGSTAGSSFGSNSGSIASAVVSRNSVSPSFGSSSGSRTASVIGSRGTVSSSSSSSDLIARIIASLGPQINSAVTAALA